MREERGGEGGEGRRGGGGGEGKVVEERGSGENFL